MRKVNLIVVHCSDSPDERDVTADDVRQWHYARGFTDIGYHFVIRRSGLIERGRDLDIAGAHVHGHNDNSIGICLIGRQAFEACQLEALHSLVKILRYIYPGCDIRGHYELDNRKTCPNIDMIRLRAYLDFIPELPRFNPPFTARKIRSVNRI